MTIPALDFAAPGTRRPGHRTAAAFQRAAADWELCTCPACILLDPERRIILLRRRAALQARFSMRTARVQW